LLDAAIFADGKNDVEKQSENYHRLAMMASH
jgi:hypothetical protein